jgi:pimeloyl-ACP methyl ester carboxylesterase
VPLQPHGSRPPLFLVHPHNGHVLGYLELARRLAPDQPVFGFEARGLHVGDAPLSERLEDIARAYVEELVEVRPGGPVLLGGHCLGGTIAFEMARQLARLGRQVALVALLDPAPGRCGPVDRLLQRAVFYRERVRAHTRDGDLVPWLLGRLTGAAVRPAPDDAARAARRGSGSPVARAMERARDGYALSRYPGRITVFQSPGYEVPSFYWRRFAADARCERLPSTRSRPEREDLVADRFRAALARALAGRPQPADSFELATARR